MRKAKITAKYIDNPNETMWFFVHLDDNNFVDIDRDNIGYGSVDWGGIWYGFNLFEHDDSRVGIDWKDKSFNNSRGTIDILDRRLAVGEIVRYIDAGEHFNYKIASLEYV